MSRDHVSKPYFDDLYRDNEDPWKIRGRWYERRKRALTLAMLPHEHYPSAFEPACGNGELTALLAPRCGELIASDINENAVALTRKRVAEFGNVTARQMVVPDAWPEVSPGAGKLDLVVISELGYYLDEPQLGRLVERIQQTLSPDGVVIACHWRRPIEGWNLDGDGVHAFLRARLGLPLLGHYEDDDMTLDLWAPDRRSVHQRES
jgi:SAM-dependent methyltransferase